MALILAGLKALPAAAVTAAIQLGFMDDLLRYLKLAGLTVIFLGIVPLAGFLVSGSAKQAWEYTKIWLRTIGLLIAAGAVLSLIFFPLML